jgi:hypothetical protein
MPVASLDTMSFSGLLWTFRLLPGKHTGTSIWHAVPFISTFSRPACGLVGQYIFQYVTISLFNFAMNTCVSCEIFVSSTLLTLIFSPQF